MSMTRARWFVGPLAAVIVLAGVAAPPARAGREARADYVATNEGVVALVRFPLFAANSCMDTVGGACFALHAGESQVRVRVADVTGLPVGGVLYFDTSRWAGWDRRNGFIRSTRVAFCGRAVVTVPRGATSLGIELGSDNDPWRTTDNEWSDPARFRPCGDGGGVPTAGTVVVFFGG